MSPRTRRILVATAAAALILLAIAPGALGAAGSGSGGFGGGGGGGGFGGGGGGGGHAIAYFFLFRLLFDIALLGHGLGFLILIGLGLLYYFMRFGAPKMQAAADARRRQGRGRRRQTRRRERRVELAAAEAADEDPIFDPEHVRAAAGALFNQIQFAWDAADRIALRGLVAPRLLDEWERRLDDLDSRGWRNRVEPVGEPKVEYVGIKNRGGDDDDRVVVRIEAKLRDYVVDRSGRHVKRAGQFTESVRLREFWTLERRGEHWVLASIEQGSEGSHALDDVIVQTAWADGQALQDEAMIEGAAEAAVPAGTSVAEVADLDYAGDARAAALDLSLADGRFAPEVLEIAARRAVAAWVDAVDGSDAALRKLADAGVVRELLHPGDPSERSRLVVRGLQVQRLTIVALDAAVEPATMTIELGLQGRRYIEDRATTKVLAGDSARTVKFTEGWTLAVTGDAAEPWRVVAVQAPSGARSG